MSDRFLAMPRWLRLAVYLSSGIAVMSTARVVTGAGQLTAEGTYSSAIALTIPIALAGLGGLWSERAGVVNIGLEGMMVLGTWFGAYGGIAYGPWQGVALGILGGLLGGLLHAVATVIFGVDHIISGVAINLLAVATNPCPPDGAKMPLFQIWWPRLLDGKTADAILVDLGLRRGAYLVGIWLALAAVATLGLYALAQRLLAPAPKPSKRRRSVAPALAP